MKKFINKPETILREALAGMAAAHADLLAVDMDHRFVVRQTPKSPGKVAIISGGGSGHEPMHAGFVGSGMLDAACAGEIFTSPTPDQMYAAAERVECGGGVLFLVKNYAGDIMNFEMGQDMLSCDTEMVVIDDDVALLGMDSGNDQGNRGVAGTVIVEKIVGAAAERGDDLASCAALGKTVNAQTGTMAVALSSCTVPASGAPSFNLAEDEVELGVGIHGEPGRATTKHADVDALVDALLGPILEKVAPAAGDEVLLFCNGLGGTPIVELYVLFNAAKTKLEERGLTVSRSLVGSYCTALDMAGASLTVTKLNTELMELWDAPAKTAALQVH